MPIAAPLRKKLVETPHSGLTKAVESQARAGHPAPLDLVANLARIGAEAIAAGVTPEVAGGAASNRREQDARIHRLIGVARVARRDSRREVTVSLRDLECLIAEINIPHDLKMMVRS